MANLQTERENLKYLRLLSEKFPTAAEAATEIMNLKAIMSLPKGTEYFLADIHGEYEAFIHVLKNASGSIREKVNDLFSTTMSKEEIDDLCTLIYYPKEIIALKKKELGIAENQRSAEFDAWSLATITQLIKVCRKAGAKYTRSKVRKALPSQYSYIMLELMHENSSDSNKSEYLQSLYDAILESAEAEDIIVAFAETIQKLVIDHLHIIGDVFDRGPGAEIIMDRLLTYHHLDIQWGNHDMLWMGAANGNLACIANVVRISLRYANLNTLQNGYGINLLPLSLLASEVYKDDDCAPFWPKMGKGGSETYDDKSALLVAKMHKAISIIQFKLEYELIKAHPEYKMESRNLLHTIADRDCPTVTSSAPYQLTEQEAEVIRKLAVCFKKSYKLQKHIDFMYQKGSLYLCCNNNLLFHASIPMNEDKSFRQVLVPAESKGKWETYCGKALYDKIDETVRRARKEFKKANKNMGRESTAELNTDLIDYFWYLWCGPDSPQFDKSAMTTFERYFNEDKATHHEEKGYYYKYRVEESVCVEVLKEFGLQGPDAHIINGHVPVKAIKGELPVKAEGKLMVIDGGFSRAYQSSTGIAGYTLIFNSQGLHIVKHSPFTSIESAIKNHDDIVSSSVVRSHSSHRMRVRDTDTGKLLKMQADDLQMLLDAYRQGLIQERG